MRPLIVPARASSLAAINGVIEAAKRGLGYSTAYVDAALPLLRVDAHYLSENRCFEGRLSDGIIGFAAVEALEPGVALLDHLWIDPSFQRRGVGRLLLEACLDAARERATLLRLYADPPSESFYRHLGAIRIGEKPSRVPGGPLFPVMEFKLPVAGPS